MKLEPPGSRYNARSSYLISQYPLAQEAHHGQVKTKQKNLDENPNWENTIEKILEKNKENILLEFTATMGFQNNKDAQYLSSYSVRS